MTDRISKEARSALMARVRARNTGPEIAVRSLLHRMGYRFRLHQRELPGSPDVVLKRHKAAIFVHGCFWHGHVGCRRGRLPETRREFWATKIARNVERDAASEAALRHLGFRVLIVWECELKKMDEVRERLFRALAGPSQLS